MSHKWQLISKSKSSILYLNRWILYSSQFHLTEIYQWRDHFVCAPSQWERETALHCNVFSQWLGTYTKWSLQCHLWNATLFVVYINKLKHVSFFLFLNQNTSHILTYLINNIISSTGWVLKIIFCIMWAYEVDIIIEVHFNHMVVIAGFEPENTKKNMCKKLSTRIMINSDFKPLAKLSYYQWVFDFLQQLKVSLKIQNCCVSLWNSLRLKQNYTETPLVQWVEHSWRIPYHGCWGPGFCITRSRSSATMVSIL